MTTRTDRGLILPVVLMILLLLGLLVAMFSFRVNADLASTQAVAFRLQTRLAAEAGIERVKLLLKESRFDVERWYHNVDELHRIVVWAAGSNETVWGTNEEGFDDGEMVYRFSVVADDPTDDEDYVRFGITDESSKLNLNTATAPQLQILLEAALEDDAETSALDIVHAILDWRDKDKTSRSAKGDTEGEYYQRLPRPYRVKNGPFDTVEELLLVKGVTGGILYGEDFDRNGLLTPNEDDGDDFFPPDNQDGVLNRGLYPYLTVLSSENNVSNDNRPRVYLLGEEAAVREELAAVFPDEPDVVEFIVVAARGKSAGSGRGGGKPGGGGAKPGKSEGGDEPPAGAEAAGTGDAGGAPAIVATGPIKTPAALLRSQTTDGKQIAINNPLTLEHLSVLLDQTTTVKDDQKTIPGLINVNTAPLLVLRCIEELSEEQIDTLIDVRETLDGDRKSTPAWLLIEGVVDADTFEQIAPKITARGQQFTVEVLGYADHIGMVTRLQVVIDMVGPIAQTVYYRDLSYLGGHYPIREDDLEKVRGR